MVKCQSCIDRGSPRPNPGPGPCVECEIRSKPSAAGPMVAPRPSETKIKNLGRVEMRQPSGPRTRDESYDALRERRNRG
jgi:hypothetical protein